MKKSLKKCLALLLAVVMVMAMSVVAMAEGTETPTTNKITISSATEGSTYTIYKLASWQVTEGKTHSLVVEESFKEIVTNEMLAGLATKNSTNDSDTSNDYWAKASSAQQYATEIANKIKTVNSDENNENNVTGTTSNNGVFDGLGLGYYLIVETATGGTAISTAPILVPVTGGETTVNPKRSETNVTKVIEKNSNDYTKSTEDIGDAVNYRLDAQVPVYDSNATNIIFKITDIASKGLTVNKNTVKVYGVKQTSEGVTETELTNDGNTYYIISNVDAVTDTEDFGEEYKGGSKFTVDFTYDNIKEYDYVSVKYSATLNENCVVEDNGNPNKVKLTYTNNYSTGSTHDTDWTEVRTYTYKFNIYKKWKQTDGSFAPLEGAKFVVYKKESNPTEYIKYYYSAVAESEEENTTVANATPNPDTSDVKTASSFEIDENTKYDYVFTTGKDGFIYLTGLDIGTYVIKEIKAPEGFNLAPETEFTISVGEQNNAVKEIITEYTSKKTEKEVNGEKPKGQVTMVEIEDTKGITLPGTGGIGTTIFTIGGIVLVLLAAVMFIVYMRRQKEEQA